MTIWAFNQSPISGEIAESVRNGVSRFGFSGTDENNLLLKDNWTKHHSKQRFLLKIKEGDWIVHINTPYYGRCITGKVKSTYGFDEGLKVDWWNGVDFRHCFELDTKTILEFDRNDRNVLPSVNLTPRGRQQRVLAVEDFFQSIENLKNGAVTLPNDQTKEEYHLKEKTESILESAIKLIQETHKGKNLETYLAKVFRNVHGVVDVIENGSGWGTDHGADLIVITTNPLMQLDTKIIVQVKSYTGNHYALDAVNQVETGIEKYEGDAGMIITTAQKTGELQNKVSELSQKLGKPIELLDHTDLAKFIIKNAPELLFRLDDIS